MNKKKQIKPKWFEGAVYKKGATVQNRFGGESYELNALELSIYDFIIGASDTVELGWHHDKLIVDLRKGLDWFKENNAKAYMVLLD
tara:strand:- start:271 stop:528 length:258 start_codon:yes stop_codon:yes gene_type:complete